MIYEGQTIPSVSLVQRDGITGTFTEVTTDELFKDKRVILFALPGAFTPTCSTKQLPAYDKKYRSLTAKKNNIDEVYCLSVNDGFVMNAWFESLGIKNVKPLADGSLEFTASVGAKVQKDNVGFGSRSWRYSCVINDGVVEKVFSEEGFGNNAGTDPFEVSDAQTMLDYISEAISLRLKEQV
jgi:peroxiredoxin